MPGTLVGDSQTVSLLVTGIDISDTEVQKEVASALTGAHTDLRALVGEQNVLDPFVVPGMLSEPATGPGIHRAGWLPHDRDRQPQR